MRKAKEPNSAGSPVIVKEESEDFSISEHDEGERQNSAPPIQPIAYPRRQCRRAHQAVGGVKSEEGGVKKGPPRPAQERAPEGGV
ncbi:hypothetical protein AAFF_G00215330 [Aldrovandia affinis]|uniref:Uncharacterized protein n=1 Tax=Aldrovandia affinis TaxID=143900 RepID=A0AAD7RJ26_9TELE|nr:hypothetical protein AAFF_G00215330 [Aldrovandia affinis]